MSWGNGNALNGIIMNWIFLCLKTPIIRIPAGTFRRGSPRIMTSGEFLSGEYLYLKFHGMKDARPAVRWSYLENLFGGLIKLGKAEIFGLFLGDDLQAAAILGYAASRTIYLNGCNSDAGKENRAMFVLMDKLISQSRGEERIFDFEGSNISGVARFYEGFGGKKTIYQRIVKTSFPFLKKIK